MWAVGDSLLQRTEHFVTGLACQWQDHVQIGFHAAQCLVDAENRLLNRNLGILLKFSFQLIVHHQ
ncbi:hypothetical protein D3C85_1760740 [compost metagenome]